MKIKTKKVVWLVLLFLAVSGAAVGYYLFNKGPRDVKNSRGIKIPATELYKIFSTDSSTAYKKYSNQVLETAGMVETVTLNKEQVQLVTLKTGTEGAFINCTMDENNQNIQPGVLITLKGICSGIGEGDPDLGIMGDVYLSRCYLMK